MIARQRHGALRYLLVVHRLLHELEDSNQVRSSCIAGQSMPQPCNLYTLFLSKESNVGTNRGIHSCRRPAARKSDVSKEIAARKTTHEDTTEPQDLVEDVSDVMFSKVVPLEAATQQIRLSQHHSPRLFFVSTPNHGKGAANISVCTQPEAHSPHDSLHVILGFILVVELLATLVEILGPRPNRNANPVHTPVFNEQNHRLQRQDQNSIPYPAALLEPDSLPLIAQRSEGPKFGGV